MLTADDEAALRCPRCRAPLVREIGEGLRSIRCGDGGCAFASAGFPIVGGKAALVDFDDSVLDRDALAAHGGTEIDRREGLARRLRERLLGANDVAPENGKRFVALLRKPGARQRVLIVGGGKRGAGTEAIYGCPDIDLVSFDVYNSPDVDLIADGHRIPFADGHFDGVWVQAVLDDVLDPARVVAEIRRVLAPAELVYAETPFMQHVHERAYDFTRFTPSGHRWLFRDFSEIASGIIGGPGESLVWSIRYLARAVSRSDKIGSLVGLCFFWLRYLDRLADGRRAVDSACGVFFLGRLADRRMTPREAIAYYPGIR